jgi:hypothetical protein
VHQSDGNQVSESRNAGNSIRCDIAVDSLDLSLEIDGPAFGVSQQSSSINISRGEKQLKIL